MSNSQPQSPSRYSLLKGMDYDEPDEEKASQKPRERKRKSSFRHYLRILLIATSCLALGFTSGALIRYHDSGIRSSASFSSKCTNPPTRREWRSLSGLEKKNYIDAVQCLRRTPSKLGLNQTLYDDFPYVHSRVGSYCTSLLLSPIPTSDQLTISVNFPAHSSAAFLAWHRYFIHTYEQTLQETCGYRGHLTYVIYPSDYTPLYLSAHLSTRSIP